MTTNRGHSRKYQRNSMFFLEFIFSSKSIIFFSQILIDLKSNWLFSEPFFKANSFIFFVKKLMRRYLLQKMPNVLSKTFFFYLFKTGHKADWTQQYALNLLFKNVFELISGDLLYFSIPFSCKALQISKAKTSAFGRFFYIKIAILFNIKYGSFFFSPFLTFDFLKSTRLILRSLVLELKHFHWLQNQAIKLVFSKWIRSPVSIVPSQVQTTISSSEKNQIRM
jgi:hypothetical protein